MFGFYLLTTTFGRRWGIREAATVLSALELYDVQSIHTCAATDRKSLLAPLPNS